MMYNVRSGSRKQMNNDGLNKLTYPSFESLEYIYLRNALS